MPRCPSPCFFLPPPNSFFLALLRRHGAFVGALRRGLRHSTAKCAMRVSSAQMTFANFFCGDAPATRVRMSDWIAKRIEAVGGTNAEADHSTTLGLYSLRTFTPAEACRAYRHRPTLESPRRAWPRPGRKPRPRRRRRERVRPR